jgi:hypothetical protein
MGEIHQDTFHSRVYLIVFPMLTTYQRYCVTKINWILYDRNSRVWLSVTKLGAIKVNESVRLEENQHLSYDIL